MAGEGLSAMRQCAAAGVTVDGDVPVGEWRGEMAG